ncbi:MAG: hypothetical protein KKF20_00980 [Bacteroidetes bacterium]|nr:hypothetical protein [Bacteroidota bacterium]MBU1421737.1 hypothetical protein [Bacteroidota bacterium]MBU2470966.1 hypothetical protein [Bacteroidota bacterium]MBU2636046.1 hypothetical protein [Bacteroidota bacterium]
MKNQGTKILLDCGIFQGKRSEANERNRNFPFDPEKINAVILYFCNPRFMQRYVNGQCVYSTERRGVLE